jgi:hypothetical protein
VTAFRQESLEESSSETMPRTVLSSTPSAFATFRCGSPAPSAPSTRRRFPAPPAPLS